MFLRQYQLIFHYIKFTLNCVFCNKSMERVPEEMSEKKII